MGHARFATVQSQVARIHHRLAVSLDEGIIACTYQRQSHKIYEVYYRLMFAGIGQQSDIESLRIAAIDFTHREGFQRSEQDVTIQRVVSTLSQPIKNAFANFNAAPLVARTLFMELGETYRKDRYYFIDYDGDYGDSNHVACIAGQDEVQADLRKQLGKLKLKGMGTKEMLPILENLIKSALTKDSETVESTSQGLIFEAALLSRHKESDRRFHRLAPTPR